MFFLLFVPPSTVSPPLSDDAINEVAAQFADQLIQQSSLHQVGQEASFDITEVPPRVKQELHTQLVMMMKSMQKERLKQSEENEHQTVAQPAELGEVRNFLERCYKESA